MKPDAQGRSKSIGRMPEPISEMFTHPSLNNPRVDLGNLSEVVRHRAEALLEV